MRTRCRFGTRQFPLKLGALSDALIGTPRKGWRKLVVIQSRLARVDRQVTGASPRRRRACVRLAVGGCCGVRGL